MPVSTLNRPNEALFALDTKAPVRINPWESYLRGWFISTSQASEPTSVLGVAVEGSFVPALYGLPRPDVAHHFNDPALVNCGFYLRFRVPKSNPRIKLVAQGKSGTVVLAELNAPLVSAKGDPTVPIDSYEAWLKYREASLFWPENEVNDRLSALPYRPLLSVILPTFNPSAFLIEQCVQSVLRQQYAEWQLCISDDCSNPAAERHLRSLAASDDRITLAVNPYRAGTPETQNLALKNAGGDFIVTLDQNDELHPCALLEVARLLNQANTCEAVYSDEDKIDGYGSRSNPVFKADIDPDMLLASNYMGRLTALRRATVLALGGFRAVCDGAQDWDLLIRVLEQSGPKAIQHVPKPLYHRRIRQARAMPNLNARSSVQKSSVRALSDHLARTGKPAVVELGISPGSFRLKQSAPPAAKVAVFVLHEDGVFQLTTIRMHANRGREIAIYQVQDCAVYSVDNVSPSPLLTLTDISAEVLIFINRPLESLNHLFFEELAAQALRDECGLVTGISVDGEGRVLHSGFVDSTDGRLVDPFAGLEFSQVTHLELLNVARSVETISDRFFAIRREHLSAVGGLPSVAAGQMPQLVHKLVTNANRCGLRVIVTPFAVASFHHSLPDTPVVPVPLQNHTSISLNPNLPAFEDLAPERSFLLPERETAEHTVSEYSRPQDKLASQLNSLKSEVDSLSASLETERALRNSIETSRSWRWTRPLRELLNANKRRT